MDKHELRGLWSKSLQGDTAAINRLYAIAQQTLPQQGADSMDSIVAGAVFQVLVDATDDEPVVDHYGKVLVPKLKKSVCALLDDKVSSKTVQRFINNRSKMFSVIGQYWSEFGLK